MKRAAGFTLIEMLVAVFLLAVLGAAGFTMLYQMNITRERVLQQADRLTELQRTFYWITEDFSQIANRPVRSAVNDKIPAILFSEQGTSLLQLTRAGWTNPARDISPARSDLQRVAYSIEDDNLIRSYWYHLDPLDETPTKRRRMLTEVESLTMRFLDRTGSWHDSWPPLDEEVTGLPAAIELRFQLQDLGSVNRLFALPG